MCWQRQGGCNRRRSCSGDCGRGGSCENGCSGSCSSDRIHHVEVAVAQGYRKQTSHGVHAYWDARTSPEEVEARSRRVFSAVWQAARAINARGGKQGGREQVERKGEILYYSRTAFSCKMQVACWHLCDNSTLFAPGVEPPAWTEMAVIRPSNVGKSSLLNALLGSKDNKFVSVARHPGSTTDLDFYAGGLPNPPPLVNVDTSGYGYCKCGKDAQGEWFPLIRHCL
ncbi:MAG: hypothetical protein EOO65_03730 [Methanosarcinales archaeon]|nr:MAG: hypothetical protein EOO65_03730 [Methanosarcinales archaeon]